ncbi:hypothetical protein [Crocosphaera sp. XPORK-15E]|uniref:hypothetical protein n=1 Tax=Crocosphaera sp. XPORK-15E TaxID=3110247 RepID=UPI002B1FADB3|nr:hypothetical protein [Crocosphaera sp. XPORK-15E]MEA5536673.1 hypothetical protein [Crocosphaera sp. XPORK-15E]
MNTNQPLNINELLLNSDIGTSLWSWVKKEPKTGSYLIPVVTDKNQLTTDYEPMFLFKLALGESFRLGEKVNINFKVGYYKHNDVIAVYLLFIFPYINFIHEIWINHYTLFDDISTPLFKLQHMKQLTLLLFETKPEPERVIKISNNINWTSILTEIEKVKLWSDFAFDQVKEIAPPAHILWKL